MTMVIKATVVLTDSTVSTEHFFPAEKCVWREDPTYTGPGYRIDRGVYIDGGNAAPVLGVTAAQQHTLSSSVIGIIGKSGRFVGYSVEH